MTIAFGTPQFGYPAFRFHCPAPHAGTDECVMLRRQRHCRNLKLGHLPKSVQHLASVNANVLFCPTFTNAQRLLRLGMA
jgi:hypothetical protein